VSSSPSRRGDSYSYYIHITRCGTLVAIVAAEFANARTKAIS
jgi:hypothetical protein